MPVDFLEVRKQVQMLGESDLARQQRLEELRLTAQQLLAGHANNLAELRAKVSRAAAQNNNLRCAVPGDEALNASFPKPPLPTNATLLAADGSQINPSHHDALDFFLINVGAIQMQHGSPQAPQTFILSSLHYGDDLYTSSGAISDGMIALIRDESERSYLADLAENLPAPAFTLTDGPIELWGDEQTPNYSQRFEKYLVALAKLHRLGAITAGYVDKPRSDLVVRLLEIAALDDAQLAQAGRQRQFRGLTDINLFQSLLKTGERSPIFAIQSKSAGRYADHLALHFFYLNVASGSQSYIVRVELPRWVAEDANMLDGLHALLIYQCSILENKPYPYILQRAHETALVTHKEKEQIEHMIAIKRRSLGLDVEQKSHKQFHKDG